MVPKKIIIQVISLLGIDIYTHRALIQPTEKADRQRKQRNVDIRLHPLCLPRTETTKGVEGMQDAERKQMSRSASNNIV
ncbi:hypothetical protein AOLI_G00238070 [Acnodon oligacanthus]